MSNQFFVPGHACGVAFQVYGQGTVALLCVTSHTMEELVQLFDVSNTCHNGRTARLAGKGDHSGTINADMDLDAPPYLNPPYIRAGVSGVMYSHFKHYALGLPMQIPVIIEKVHYEFSIGSQSKWSFDVKENCLAGTFAMPAA